MSVLIQLNESLAGRYVAEREIGQGGMAMVYVARDLRHDREVALKVLKPELGAVLGKERFLAEIRVTAKLQHPHLLPLFDSGEADGQLFYVMPYVQGESLRARLHREKQLPIEEAVRMATGVAGALAYAHRHGVIHRDLKPENILLHEGQPLVADFGIALAVSLAGAARITQTGLSLGTPQYMSPEQAAGDRDLDGRSDIYSLGAVLYEMLTGDPPHTGSTAQAIIARVLTEKPRRASAARSTIPKHIDDALECALAKLPADRFGSAQEMIEALQGTRPVALPAGVATPASTTTDPTIRARRQRGSLARAAGLVGLGAALGGVAVALRRPVTQAPVSTQFALAELDSIIHFRNPPSATIAIARDGSRIVFGGRAGTRSHLYVRELNDVTPRVIPETEDAEYPILSPDGKHVLYSQAGRLRRVSLDGGAAVTVSDSGPASFTWGDDGHILYYRRGGGIFQTDINGAPARVVARPDSSRHIITFSFPHYLRGSKAALVTIYKDSYTAGTASVAAFRLTDGALIELGMPGAHPRFAGGYIFAARPNGSIIAAPFDADRLRLTGPAVPVLEHVTQKAGGAAEFDIADNGTIIYRTGEITRKLVSVDLLGKETVVSPAIREFSSPRWSPDGKRISVTIPSTERQNDIWILDARSGTLTRLTHQGGDRAEWSSDGQSVYFSHSESLTERTARLLVQRWDASDTARVFLAVKGQPILEVALPRGGRGYLAARVGVPRRDIWIAPVDSPQALRPYIETKSDDVMPSVSTDGRWLAYSSDDSGRPEIYIRPLPGPGGRIQISTEGGLQPMWSSQPGVLFYRGSGKVILARIAGLEGAPAVTRSELFDDIYSASPVHTEFSVSPDGQRLLFAKPEVEPRTIIATNWLAGMRARLAAAK